MSLLTHPAQAGQLNRLCAWTLLVLSVLTLLWSVFQLAGAMALEAWDARQWMASHNLVGTGLFGWLMVHAVSLSALQLASCLPCIGIGIGMLGGRNWARQGFIVLLLLTAVLNLAALPLLDRLFVDLLLSVSSGLPDGDGLDLLAELRDTRIMLWVTSLLPLLALSAIHVWLARRFNKPDMRQLYQV